MGKLLRIEIMSRSKGYVQHLRVHNPSRGVKQNKIQNLKLEPVWDDQQRRDQGKSLAWQTSIKSVRRSWTQTNCKLWHMYKNKYKYTLTSLTSCFRVKHRTCVIERALAQKTCGWNEAKLECRLGNGSWSEKRGSMWVVGHRFFSF